MKEPLLLLPGMMCDARLYTPQINAFSAERPTIFVPLRGANSMRALAKMVLDVAPSQFALAGLSMGGIVAMEIMRLAPERVTRLALLDTNPLADPADKAEMREAQVSQVRNGQMAAVMRDEMKPNYLADGPGKLQLLELCMEMANDLGPTVFEDQSNAIQNRPDQTETLRGVKIPTLILCGREDSLCPIERHELMHDLIDGSVLKVIAGAGHLPTLEQPEQTNKCLRDWLNSGIGCD
ncbi:alpha/beta hydrolase [Rhodobacterales bacterium HTCC2150]|nr:alpha/beta hydrolase [Rhodobacterales bacterium HTCC2150] [Rhodobacteraceae bacterium HTCC2150]